MGQLIGLHWTAGAGCRLWYGRDSEAGLELQGKENPDLVRAVHGLAGGLGFTGELCGALSGAVCLLGLYAGKGLPEEEQDPRLDFMMMDLVQWFKEKYGQSYGGIRCEDMAGIDDQIIYLDKAAVLRLYLS